MTRRQVALLRSPESSVLQTRIQRRSRYPTRVAVRVALAALYRLDSSYQQVQVPLVLAQVLAGRQAVAADTLAAVGKPAVVAGKLAVAAGPRSVRFVVDPCIAAQLIW